MPAYTLFAADRDKNVFTLKLASQLNISAAFIDSGSIIHLTKFAPLYMNYTDKDDTRALLLLLDFDAVCLMPLLDRSLASPPERCHPVTLSKTSAADPQPAPLLSTKNNCSPSINDRDQIQSSLALEWQQACACNELHGLGPH